MSHKKEFYLSNSRRKIVNCVVTIYEFNFIDNSKSNVHNIIAIGEINREFLSNCVKKYFKDYNVIDFLEEDGKTSFLMENDIMVIAEYAASDEVVFIDNPSDGDYIELMKKKLEFDDLGDVVHYLILTH